MKFEKGVPVASQNLASALENEEGTFLCYHGGQSYITESRRGHSIVSGPSPVGPRVAQSNQQWNQGPEPWIITKISDRTVDFRDDQSSGSGSSTGGGSLGRS